MEITPERIRSLVEEVTQELTKEGIVSSSPMRARERPAAGPIGRAYGSRAAGGATPPRSHLDYGNVAGRPGSYGGGFAGDDPLSRLMQKAPAPAPGGAGGREEREREREIMREKMREI